MLAFSRRDAGLALGAITALSVYLYRVNAAKRKAAGLRLKDAVTAALDVAQRDHVVRGACCSRMRVVLVITMHMCGCCGAQLSPLALDHFTMDQDGMEVRRNLVWCACLDASVSTPR